MNERTTKVAQRNNSFFNNSDSIAQMEKDLIDMETAMRGTPSTESIQQNPSVDNQNPTQNVDPNLDTSGSNAQATSEEEMTYRKRYTDLKQHYDKAISQERQRFAELEQKFQGSVNPPQTEEEFEAFKNSNPDMFKAMETMLMKNQASGVTESRVSELETELANVRQEKALNEIQKKHSDFYDVVSSSEWKAWVDSQPIHIKNMVEGNTDDSTSFIRALDLYKFDTGSTSASQPVSGSNNSINTQSSAADAVNTTGAGENLGNTNQRIWTTTEIAKMSIQEYEHFSDDIEQARKEGRIRDDVRRN